MTTGRFRRPFGALALSGLVLLGACSSSDDAAPTTTATPATSTTAGIASAPTVAAPTTTPPTPAPPTTVADGPTPSTGPPATASPTPSTVPPADAVDWTSIVTELLRIEFELPMDPSLEGIDELCATVSSCRETWTTTVQNLLDNGWRVEGGVPYELQSVEFQDTVDSVPLDEALAVTLIVRQIVTEQGEIVLVDGEGDVVGTVDQDPTIAPGDGISRPFIVGRDTIDSPWKLVAQGAAS